MVVADIQLQSNWQMVIQVEYERRFNIPLLKLAVVVEISRGVGGGRKFVGFVSRLRFLGTNSRW